MRLLNGWMNSYDYDIRRLLVQPRGLPRCTPACRQAGRAARPGTSAGLLAFLKQGPLSQSQIGMHSRRTVGAVASLVMVGLLSGVGPVSRAGSPPAPSRKVMNANLSNRPE